MLVVGDETTLKVHLHTDEPELATAVFAGAGEVSRLDVADMHARWPSVMGACGGADVPPGRAAGGVGASAAALGADGALRGRRGRQRGRAGRDVRELGVQTVDGGPTLNPSTYDLLAGIHDVPAEEVVVLANSANVIMAAERAAELSDKQVLVVHTTSQQAGLAAAVALAPERAVEENAQALRARSRGCARARSRPLPATIRRGASRAERRSGSSMSRCGPGASRVRRCATCWRRSPKTPLVPPRLS